jgi:hypothetical protein
MYVWTVVAIVLATHLLRRRRRRTAAARTAAGAIVLQRKKLQTWSWSRPRRLLESRTQLVLHGRLHRAQSRGAPSWAAAGSCIHVERKKPTIMLSFFQILMLSTIQAYSRCPEHGFSLQDWWWYLKARKTRHCALSCFSCGCVNAAAGRDDGSICPRRQMYRPSGSQPR